MVCLHLTAAGCPIESIISSKKICVNFLEVNRKKTDFWLKKMRLIQCKGMYISGVFIIVIVVAATLLT